MVSDIRYVALSEKPIKYRNRIKIDQIHPDNCRKCSYAVLIFLFLSEYHYSLVLKVPSGLSPPFALSFTCTPTELSSSVIPDQPAINTLSGCFLINARKRLKCSVFTGQCSCAQRHLLAFTFLTHSGPIFHSGRSTACV